MSLLDLTDVKPHLKIDQSTDDTVLQAKLDAAEEFVSRRSGGHGGLASTSVTETLRSCGSIVLTYTPVDTVTSVTGEVFGDYPVADLWIDENAGVIEAKAFTNTLFDDRYTVAYTTGYASAADLPDELAEAVRLMMQHFYETQRGPLRRGGDLTVQPSADSTFTRAQQILDNFRAPGFA